MHNFSFKEEVEPRGSGMGPIYTGADDMPKVSAIGPSILRTRITKIN